MVIRRRLALLILAGVLIGACGKKGPLLPPVSRVPQSPENIRVYQQGDALMIEWTNPQSYIDGSPLGPVVETEIWVWEPPAEEEKAVESPTAREMAKRGRMERSLSAAEMEEHKRLGGTSDDPPVYCYVRSLDENEIGGMKAYALRARDQRRRPSAFSNPSAFEARALPRPPKALDGKVFEDRIEIHWQAPEANIDGSKPADVSGYHIYKMEENGSWRRLTPKPVKDLVHADKSPVFGHPVRYFVRAALSDPKSPRRYLESADSSVLEITPEDVFPPAAPEGLTSVSGRGFISVSWQPNREKDLKGYQIRRKEEGQADFRLLTPQPVPEAVFTDGDIEPGRTYTYAVAAVDFAGNISPETELVVESHKDELP